MLRVVCGPVSCITPFDCIMLSVHVRLCCVVLPAVSLSRPAMNALKMTRTLFRYVDEIMHCITHLAAHFPGNDLVCFAVLASPIQQCPVIS